jgi:hypothetical protein
MEDPTLEKMFEIWCGEWHYEVGPCRDIPENIEIRYYEGNSRATDRRMSFAPKEAECLLQALTELLGK